MKTFWNYLIDYVKKDFNKKSYLTVACFLGLSLFFIFKYDLSAVLRNKNSFSAPVYFLLQLLILLFPYVTVVLIQCFYTQNYQVLRNKKFWAGILFACGIWSLNRTIDLSDYIVVAEIGKLYWFKNLKSLNRILFILIPLFLFYLLNDRKAIGHFYGLNNFKTNFQPYWIMFGCMVVLTFLAARLLPEFLRYYPMYERTIHPGFSITYAASLGLAEWQLILPFEFLYASRFITVEVFFRGFLIFHMSKHLGDKVVLPMAAMYCFLHAGKPLGEAISSIFGGYILGVFALKSKNVYGGILIHMGIALLMEVFAFWLKG